MPPKDREQLLKLANRLRHQRKVSKYLYPVGIILCASGIWWSFSRAWMKIPTLGEVPQKLDLSQPEAIIAYSVAESLTIVIPIFLGFVCIGGVLFFVAKLVYPNPAVELALKLADMIAEPKDK